MGFKVPTLLLLCSLTMLTALVYATEEVPWYDELNAPDMTYSADYFDRDVAEFVDVTDNNYDKVINGRKPTLMMFWQAWKSFPQGHRLVDGISRALQRTKHIAKELGEPRPDLVLAKMGLQENPHTSLRFNHIRTFPTVAIYPKGKKTPILFTGDDYSPIEIGKFVEEHTGIQLEIPSHAERIFPESSFKEYVRKHTNKHLLILAYSAVHPETISIQDGWDRIKQTFSVNHPELSFAKINIATPSAIPFASELFEERGSPYLVSVPPGKSSIDPKTMLIEISSVDPTDIAIAVSQTLGLDPPRTDSYDIFAWNKNIMSLRKDIKEIGPEEAVQKALEAEQIQDKFYEKVLEVFAMKLHHGETAKIKAEAKLTVKKLKKLMPHTIKTSEERESRDKLLFVLRAIKSCFGSSTITNYQLPY